MALFPTASYADIAEATFTPQGVETYARIKESEVQIYVYKPEFKFKVIGVIEARGLAGPVGSLLDQLNILQMISPPSEKEDIALAMKALRTEAAENGASGVLILQSRQVRVNQTTTERRIRAVALIPIE